MKLGLLKDDANGLESTEKCNATLSDSLKNTELRRRLKIECISNEMSVQTVLVLPCGD